MPEASDETLVRCSAAGVVLQPGMLTNHGRFDGTIQLDTSIELRDRATFLLCLDQLATRTGLDPSAGLLWYLNDDLLGDDPVWVLEDRDETRTRDGDTPDPAVALARALHETHPGISGREAPPGA